MELFATVVDAGSFAAAGRAIGVPTSTVSRRIGRLEARLGALLLQRTTRKVTPTPTGQAYYARCKQIVADIAEAEAAVARTHAEPRGTLRIAGPPDNGLDLMGTIVSRFLARYPDVDVDVDVGTRYVDLIAEGFDVALRAGTLTNSSLIARRLLHSPVGAVASVGYLDRHGRPGSLDDLREHCCLVGGVQYVRSRWPLLAGGYCEVPARLRTNEFRLLRVSLLAEQGIACLPLGFLRQELHDGTVERVLPDLVGSVAGLYVVYPSNRHLSAKVRAFIDFAVEVFAEFDTCVGES